MAEGMTLRDAVEYIRNDEAYVAALAWADSYDSLHAAAEAADALIVKLYDQDAIPSLMQYEVDGVRAQLRSVTKPNHPHLPKG